MLVRGLAWLLALIATSGAHAGTVERHQIDARSLSGNALRLPTLRGVSVYVPDGYAAANRRFPVIYYLSGFFEDDQAPYVQHSAKALFDTAIKAGVIGDVIVVTADFSTPAGGSWYVNSPATGRWEDFMARELVPWIDARYRTLARSESRGVAGDRMGGYGAIRFGMTHPELFGSVYALHPIGAGPGLQPMFARPDWELIQGAKGLDDLKADGFSLVFTSIFQAFLPDPARAPLYFAPPARKTGERLEVDAARAEQLHAAFFLERLVPVHADNLRKLDGLMIDWARGDAIVDHIVSNQALTRVLDAFAVPYEAEEYRGGFGERHWGEGGRIYTEVLPFFARKLAFQAP